MMKTNPNDPINMDNLTCTTAGDVYLGSDMSHFSGLTKREEFAKAAMNGMLANPLVQTDFEFTGIGAYSVKMAEALIEALNDKKD